MNLLLVIALCGNTYSPTEPTCSRDELAKCSEAPPGRPETVEEELNRECRVTMCRLKIYDRCGIAIFERPIFQVKGYQRVVDGFCSNSSPLRTKFIENFRCIQNIMDRKDKDFERHVMMCGYEDLPRDEFCRKTQILVSLTDFRVITTACQRRQKLGPLKIPDVFSCTVEYITKNCGSDAGEVFGVAGLPLLDDYDCLSS